jgi:hypothetical protein
MSKIDDAADKLKNATDKAAETTKDAAKNMGGKGQERGRENQAARLIRDGKRERPGSPSSCFSSAADVNNGVLGA